MTVILLVTMTACSNQAVKPKTASTKHTSDSTVEELTIYKAAIIALNNDELDKAQSLFLQMSERQPDIAGTWANLALISVKKGELEQATAFVETALEKNPNMPQALNLSGYLAQNRGEINQAESYYLQALTHKDDYALAHYNLALLYDVYFQDIANAIEHYQFYLVHSEQADEATQNWLEGLKATMAASNS